MLVCEDHLADVQDAEAKARAASERAAALQEQLEAVKVRLQEAHAAKESSATPSKEVCPKLICWISPSYWYW